jgi:preprotein translocase subunit YajC
MVNLLSALPLLLGAPEAGGGASGGGSGQLVTTFVTFGLVILIFYFLIIRPQNKKNRETKNMLAAIKKGDKVVTAGGIRGTILSVKDQVVMLKVDDNVKLEFSKSAISTVLEQLKEPAKIEKKDNKKETAGTQDEE